MKHTIDIELIRKKILQSLSVEEEAAFKQWLAEHPRHRTFFKHAKKYWLQGSRYNNGAIDTAKAWASFQSQINKPRRIMYQWAIGTVVAAGLAGLVMLLNTISTEQTEQVLAELTASIKPGNSRAVLILDDGAEYELIGNDTFILDEGNYLIQGSGEKLSYRMKTGNAIDSDGEMKYNRIAIPRGGEFYLELADGTKVWLNSGTTLRYPVQFSSNERRVELTGEAFFEVTTDESVPFYVVSGSQTVKVLGTEFNISSYEDDDVISTTLVNGKVEIYLDGEKESLLVLCPNEQSHINKQGDVMYKQEVDPLPYIAWKEGRFVFRDQSLPVIMQTLSRWYDVEYVFACDDKKNIRFTGNLERYENFEDILEKIEKTDEVHFSIENKKIIIK